MSIGILIITHENIGRVILEAATETLGECPLEVEVIDAPRCCDPDEILERVTLSVNRLDKGDGVLTLTDLYGATPSNVCSRLLGGTHKIAVVAGLNLSMMIRVLNYPEESLYELVNKAVDAGKTGVLQITESL